MTTLLKQKAERQFQATLDDYYRRANPGKFKEAPKIQAEIPKEQEETLPEEVKTSLAKYNPSEASKPLYRHYWRKQFLKAGIPLPPELQVKPRGRHTHKTSEERREQVRKCKERRKLEKAGLPVPEELQRKYNRKIKTSS